MKQDNKSKLFNVMSRLDKTFKPRLDEELSGKFNLPDETQVDMDHFEYYEDHLRLAMENWISSVRDANIEGDEEILVQINDIARDILRKLAPRKNTGFNDGSEKMY